MANLTAHVEKEISFLEKCPFIEKANCTEGWVRQSQANLKPYRLSSDRHAALRVHSGASLTIVVYSCMSWKLYGWDQR